MMLTKRFRVIIAVTTVYRHVSSDQRDLLAELQHFEQSTSARAPFYALTPSLLRSKNI